MEKCAICGKPIRDVDTIYIDEEPLCPHCAEEKTVICDHCNERVWRSEAIFDDSYTLCECCYDDDFTHCDNCGRLIPNNYAHYDEASERDYCDDCYSNHDFGSIEGYHYKPAPVFYGVGSLYIGVELEIDDGGEYSENADTLMDIGNKNQHHIYCKHDGSLNDGFEIVSHPMTLDYHVHEMNWKAIMDKAVRMDYRSHETDTCGLHCHVNRTAFGSTEAEQEAVTARIVFFVENHWNELLKFSRRTVENMNRWASRYGISENTAITYKNAKDKQMGRYVAVNLTNDTTVEFRLFRGTLNYNTFIATLQLVDEICRICSSLDDRKIEALSWSDFVGNICGKPELINYLKSRRLYINEPTEESEEL